jgi:predicted dehydrogenase
MKFLIVGLGSIGQRHITNIKAIMGGEAKISAYRVVGMNKIITQQLTINDTDDIGKKYDITIYNDFDKALNDSPDCVLICNPSSLHISTALKSAEKGCHIFIEKPVSHTWEGIDQLIKIVCAKNLVSMVGFQLRFNPGLKIIQNLLRENIIGPLIAANISVGEFMPGWHKYEDYRCSYAAKKELGGGVILTLIHEIDYCYCLFGMPKRIYTTGGKLSSLEINIEDTASSLLEYWREGKIFPVHIYQDFLQFPPDRKCEIIGEYGKIAWNLLKNEITVCKRDGCRTQYSFDQFERNKMFIDEISHFISCIKDKKKSDIDLIEGLQSLKIALAAKKSMDTRAIVEIEP